MRTCTGCGRRRAQGELMRFAVRAGRLELDQARRLPGRGAYTCPELACFERALAHRGFARTLRQPVAARTQLAAAVEEELARIRMADSG